MGAENENMDSQEEVEIVYGPDPCLKKSFSDILQDYCGWINFIIFSLIFFFGTPIIIALGYFFPPFWLIGIAYVLWIIYDRETPHKGGRKIEFMRRAPYWKYRRDYFPVKMVKTCELPPDTTYMFPAFPHGLFVFGAATNFLSEANNFSEAYPGLNPFAATLNANFKLCGTRDLLLAFGCCAVSEEGILNILNGPPGNVCVVIVGGIAEALQTYPGTNRLVLKNRKGFVRIALKAGSPLVPVFSFGETDTYDQISSEWYRRLQKKLWSVAGIPFIIPRGSGFLGYRIFPDKRPVTTVVGKPIKLPKVENPTKEMIDKYHKIFIKELTELFEKYKVKYDSQGEKATLILE